jgi:HEPN domain-containing protein
MNPNHEKTAPGSPSQWMAHAESDLRMARLGAEDSAVLREQVCFHAQQAAEKALKAILLSRNIEFPYTHDIKGLLKIAETGGFVLPPAIQQATNLTPYAVETRYPGDWMEITESEVTEALLIAEKTVNWAKGILTTGGQKP